MSRRFLFTLTLLVALGLFSTARLYGQPSSAHSSSRPLLTLEAVSDRKKAAQLQLKDLDQSNLSEEEQDRTRGHLRQLLEALRAFEDAYQRRESYQAQLDSLPKRLEEMAAARKKLEKRASRRLPKATESLRAEYESHRQALEAELDNLTTQSTSGGVRLAHLPAEIQQRYAGLEQLEQDQQDARFASPQESHWGSDAERLDIQIQAHRVDIEALEAERLWLSKRGPLHDALVGNTRLRLSRVQEDLQAIQTALGEAFQAQQESLNTRAEQLQQALETSSDPAEKAHLQVQLETVDVQRRTAEYQRERTELDEAVHVQETRNTRVKQDTDRLTSLVEKYSSGERVVQRLLVGFERLRRERKRFTDDPIYAFQTRLRMMTGGKVDNPLQVLQAELRGLSGALFTVDDRLYEFDRRADEQLSQLAASLDSVSTREREVALLTMRSGLEAQRAALRDQQQALTGLTQSASRLISLHHDHKRLLDEGYRLVLSKMFWLKNSDPLRWTLVHDMAASAISTATRSVSSLRLDVYHLRMHLKESVGLWGLILLLFILAPWAAWRLWLHFQLTIRESLDLSSRDRLPPSAWAVILVALQAVVWPAYLALLGWSRQLFIRQDGIDADASIALVHGFYTIALVLGIGFFCRGLLRPDGWAQRFWELDDDLRRFLRRAVTIACLAGIVFLVPKQVVLATAADGGDASGSQTLARLLFLVFQGVIFMLILRVGWRKSLLMDRVLSRSRDHDGLLWRIWPFIHLLILCVVAGIMLLDVLGYRYAARFVWLNGLESLSIALGFRLILLLLLMHFIQNVVQAVYNLGRRRRDPAREQAAQRSLSVLRFVTQLVLAVIAVTLILELWGVSVWSLLTSQLGSQIATRAFICLMTIGLAIVIIQVSNVLAEYILRPRLTAQGEALEMGRQLRTLTPLVQTILKVAVAFIAVLILLEQVNIQTGPILTGVGIFGLAVGFASQSLIKDVINGLFILFEDSISVGDVGTVRGIAGVVERITLRAVTIRDIQGDVHVIPNSTIDMVTNKTKDFSRYLLDVGVAYREDVDTVIELLKEVDNDMQDEPRYRYYMLEPIEILGLDRFDDSAVYVRARLKTRPGKQWEIGREFNRRMKKMFDERGVEIPFPHRTLYWGLPKQDEQRPVRITVENSQPQVPRNGVDSDKG